MVSHRKPIMNNGFINVQISSWSDGQPINETVPPAQLQMEDKYRTDAWQQPTGAIFYKGDCYFTPEFCYKARK